MTYGGLFYLRFSDRFKHLLSIYLSETYAFSLIRLKVCKLICACILNVRCCILYTHRDWRTALHSHTIITGPYRHMAGRKNAIFAIARFPLLRGSDLGPQIPRYNGVAVYYKCCFSQIILIGNLLHDHIIRPFIQKTNTCRIS